jgi:tetratricopeptide (TPR) repeat protein
VIAQANNKKAAVWSPLCYFFPALFLIAFLVRLLALYFQAGNVENLFPFTDSANFFNSALKLISGSSPGRGFFYQANGYPLFLTLVFKIFGAQSYAIFIVQSLLGALTVAFTGLIARGLSGNRTIGWLAGLSIAFYGPLIVYDFMLLSEGLAAFLVVLFLYVLLKPPREKKLLEFTILGFLAGLTVLVRTNFLPPLLLAALWSFYESVHPGKKICLYKSIFLFCCAFALVVTPVALLNYQSTGTLSFVPQSGGLNLFMGNHPDQDKWFAVRSYEFDKFHRLAAKEGIYDARRENSFFYNKAVRIILDNPVFFAQHMVKKALTFFAPEEIANSENLYILIRDNSFLQKLIWKTDSWGFPFGLLFLLLVVGYLSWFKRLPLPVHAFLLLYPLSVIVFHVSGRLRLPVIPLFIIVAAMGFYELFSLIKNRRFIALSVCLFVAVLLATVTTIYSESPWEKLNFDAEQDFMKGRWLYDYLSGLDSKQALSASVLGYRLHSHSMLKVKSLYDSAIEKNSQLAAAFCARGVLHADVLADKEKAHADFTRAIELDSQSFTAWGAIGVFYLKHGRHKEAVAAFSEAIKLHPGDPKAFDGRAMARQGFDQKGALDDLNQALQIDPFFLSAYNNRGQLYMAMGKLDKAREDFSRALKIDSSFSQALNNRANAWFRSRKYEAALKDYNAAIELVPNYQKALYNRGILHLNMKSPEKARDDLFKYKNNGGMLEPELLKFLQREQSH